MIFRTFVLSIVLAVGTMGYAIDTSNSSLTEQLKAMAEESGKKIPPEKLAVMQHAIDGLKASGIAEKALKVGDTAPRFKLPDVKAGTIDSAQLLKKGPIVLAFYRGGWCPYCNLQLHALEKAVPQFKAKGANLVAISPQTPDNSLSTAQKAALSFFVLSDRQGRVAKRFGVWYEIPPELKKAYQEFGLDLGKTNGSKEWGLPLAATYVISPNGKITYAFVDTDYKKRADPVDILKALAQTTS